MRCLRSGGSYSFSVIRFLFSVLCVNAVFVIWSVVGSVLQSGVEGVGLFTV